MKKVFVGDLIAAARSSRAKCPECGGTGLVTREIGPASFRTYTEECTCGTVKGVQARIRAKYSLQAWGSACWFGTRDAAKRGIFPALRYDIQFSGDYAVPRQKTFSVADLRREEATWRRKSARLPKNPALRRALTAAILSAGAWADHFRGDTLVTVFPPYVPAGITALTRAGRRDLIPALRRRAATGRYDVTCLEVARSITE